MTEYHMESRVHICGSVPTERIIGSTIISIYANWAVLRNKESSHK